MSTPSHLSEPDRNEIRERLLADFNVPEAALHYATEGLLDTSDLWWLYDEHRIMAGGDAWLLALLWEGNLAEDTDELENPHFSEWFGRGRR